VSDDKQDKPETTEDLKKFLNNDPEDLPEAQVDDVPTAPGGVDADENESDVGRGESDDLVTRDQPLAAQQDEDDVPDEIREPGADADKADDTATDEEPQDDEGEEAPD
jgi:hypothetical protein